MTSGWTQERRAKQTKMIQQWQPWKSSTEPRTKEGKETTPQNAFKRGTNKLLKELSCTIGVLKKQLDEFTKD